MTARILEGIGLESPNHNVLELDVPGVALQTDVAFGRACRVGRNGIIGNKLTVQLDLDGSCGGLDFKRVPLPGFGTRSGSI